MKIPSLDEIEKARTSNGGWTKKQLAEWGVPWPPPKGWKATLTQSKSCEARSSQKRDKKS